MLSRPSGRRSGQHLRPSSGTANSDSENSDRGRPPRRDVIRDKLPKYRLSLFKAERTRLNTSLSSDNDDQSPIISETSESLRYGKNSQLRLTIMSTMGYDPWAFAIPSSGCDNSADVKWGDIVLYRWFGRFAHWNFIMFYRNDIHSGYINGPRVPI